MPKTSFQSVDDYIAAQPESIQDTLHRIRAILHKALPGADEVISYQIPAYKIAGKAVIYFAGWKEHFSLYPVSDPLVEAFREELAPYKRSKGTIRFPLSQPIPTKLIAGIAKFRAKEVVAPKANLTSG
jgi:uncharacterized protein YdhG (YjbR/CyaY superfamily)